VEMASEQHASAEILTRQSGSAPIGRPAAGASTASLSRTARSPVRCRASVAEFARMGTISSRYWPGTGRYSPPDYASGLHRTLTIIRAKVGLLQPAQKAWQRQPSPQDDGVQPRQLLPLQGIVRQRRRAGLAGDQPPEADPEEPHGTGNRRSGCRDVVGSSLS
jgi:hypothetical protein